MVGMDLSRLPLPRRPGTPVALPPLLDAVSERWWALPPRFRQLVIAVGVVAVLALAGRGATTSPWGPPVTVKVLAHDLPAGSPLTAADLVAARWPADLVPSDAITELSAQARLRAPGVAGSVLTDRHVAAGTAGLLPDDGSVAVSVPMDGLPALATGDVLDVVATATDGSARRVATAARVVAVDGAWLWLAVARDDADAVTAAGATGRLSVAVRPG